MTDKLHHNLHGSVQQSNYTYVIVCLMSSGINKCELFTASNKPVFDHLIREMVDLKLTSAGAWVK